MIFLATSVLASISSAAQTVRIGPDRALAGSSSSYAEPVIATHPSDPDRMAVVAIAGFTRARGAPGWHCATWQSHDAGESWDLLPIDLTECADPAAVFDEQGRLHVAVLGGGGGGGGVTLLRSDTGERWDHRQRLRGSDHPMLLRGPEGLLLVSTATERVAGDLLSGLLVMRSLDDGDSFTVIEESIPPGERGNAIAPVVTGAGAVVHGGITFMEFQGGRGRFLDQGRVWTRRQRAEGLAPAVVIGESCQTRVGFPTLVGGPEEVYAVCVGAGALDVLVYSSPDGGRSWSAPVGVLGGEEPRLDFERPIERQTRVLRRAVGAAANQEGVLGVVWQDREGDPRRACQRLVFAASFDGGRTFTSPTAVSSEDSCPANPANREAGLQWPAGTDYGAISVEADGSFVVAWPDAREGAFRIRTARIEVGR